jgi:hypothetical protein
MVSGSVESLLKLFECERTLIGEQDQRERQSDVRFRQVRHRKPSAFRHQHSAEDNAIVKETRARRPPRETIGAALGRAAPIEECAFRCRSIGPGEADEQ